MAYTIMVAVFVSDVKDATEAYNKALSGMNAACAIPGISYETTDEWFDNDGEQLMEDEINAAVQKSIILEQMAADEGTNLLSEEEWYSLQMEPK